MFKKTYYLLMLLFTMSLLGCTKDEDEILTSPTLPLQASQVMPATSSKGTGSLSAKFNKGTKILNYTVTWADLSGSHEGVRLYTGARKLNGPAVRTLATNGNMTGSLTESWTVPDSLISRLEQGLIYVSIQTAQFPNGEIRGQLEF